MHLIHIARFNHPTSNSTNVQHRISREFVLIFALLSIDTTSFYCPVVKSDKNSLDLREKKIHSRRAKSMKFLKFLKFWILMTNEEQSKTKAYRLDYRTVSALVLFSSSPCRDSLLVSVSVLFARFSQSCFFTKCVNNDRYNFIST